MSDPSGARTRPTHLGLEPRTQTQVEFEVNHLNHRGDRAAWFSTLMITHNFPERRKPRKEKETHAPSLPSPFCASFRLVYAIYLLSLLLPSHYFPFLIPKLHPFTMWSTGCTWYSTLYLVYLVYHVPYTMYHVHIPCIPWAMYICAYVRTTVQSY